MFEQKKTQLFEVNKTSTTSTSAFVNAGLKETSVTKTGNGDKAYTTTGNVFIDQFAMFGTYKEPRSFDKICKDCEILWSSDKLNSLKFMFFIRMISRKINCGDKSTEISQKGGELKHEGIMRLIWLHLKDSEIFWKNAHLIPWFGSWKDIFTMMRYDLIYNGWGDRKLDWDKFGKLILSGLSSSNEVNLIKKYLPQIRAKSKCTTVESQANCLIAKYICSLLFGKTNNKSFDEKYNIYTKYSKLKSSGTAHEWQQLISKQKYELIDFDKIAGRALSLLVRSKFLANHNLTEKYQNWISSPETKDVKYTGFVHELFSTTVKYKNLVSMPKNEQDTINKQFETLVNKVKDGESKQTNLIVVRDTSASMGSIAPGTKMSCYNIAKALALYFSEFLTGKFANSWIEFNSNAKLHNWSGNTPLDKWYNDKSGYIGSTDFLKVIDLFIQIKNTGVPESEFPTGILCISDCEFNPSGQLNKTCIERVKTKLLSAGFSNDYVNNFVIVLWNLQNNRYGTVNKPNFQTYGDVQNVYYFGGYSASVISFLTGEKIKTTYDLFDEAMNQESLNWITL